MKTIFTEFNSKLTKVASNEDTETAHADADDILIEIAISASKGDLTLKEVKALIVIYHTVDKWYA